jgi:hypothetical protein
VILGVVKLLLDVARAVPAVAAAYQLIVSPAPADADNPTVPVPHLAADVPTANDGCAFTVATTAVRVAEAHVVAVITDPT